MFEGEWRHRLIDGAYSIKAAGIFQADPGYFAGRDGADSPTAKTFRGVDSDRRPVRYQRQMGMGLDRSFDDRQPVPVRLSARAIRSRSFDPFQTGVAAEGVSQLYLTGAGERSYFDIRSIYYYGFSEQDIQAKFRSSIRCWIIRTCWRNRSLGGEFSYKFNLTEPDAATGRIRRHHPERRRTLAPATTPPIPPCRQLPAARHPGNLHAILRPRPTGAAPSSPTTAR